MNNQERLIEVLQASKAWIDHFNFGDVAYCVDRYHPDATLIASPAGEFRGRQQIEQFWRPFMTQGATDLIYTQIWLKELDADTVVLGAHWAMNVGSGIISHEQWQRNNAGIWQLYRDEFSILQQQEP
ncbi:YybH family protein [Ferrimonas pelagia]|uniref:SnoaL-like domain-containing protein n=1 Tax=Ferrimonas pelagia TaxID=1177826 RepID=A0ABP9EW94_9GAMM